MRSRTTLTAPEVSVVIPTRNRASVLGRALGSALGQRDVSVELIVVDDHSTDTTTSLLSGLTDPRVRTFRNHPARGVAHTRNRGIAHARAPWIAFLDDDDVWPAYKLAEQLDAARESDAAWVYGSAVIVDASYTPLRIVPAPPPADLATRLRLENLLPAGHSDVLVRADVVRAVGGFDTQLSPLADWDLWLRLSSAHLPATTQAVTSAYVLHPASMSTSPHGADADFVYFAAKHLSPSEAHTLEIAAARWRAYAHRRSGQRLAAIHEYVTAGLRHLNPGMLARAIGTALGEQAMAIGAVGHRVGGGTDLAWLEQFAPEAGRDQ